MISIKYLLVMKWNLMLSEHKNQGKFITESSFSLGCHNFEFLLNGFIIENE